MSTELWRPYCFSSLIASYPPSQMMMARRLGVAMGSGVAAGLAAQQTAKSESVGDVLGSVASRLSRIEVRTPSIHFGSRRVVTLA